MKTYYQTAHYEPGENFPIVTAHETFDEAVKFAEAHGIAIIEEIGGSWGTFDQCDICGEWFSADETEFGICYRCSRAIKEHGG